MQALAHKKAHEVPNCWSPSGLGTNRYPSDLIETGLDLADSYGQSPDADLVAKDGRGRVESNLQQHPRLARDIIVADAGNSLTTATGDYTGDGSAGMAHPLHCVGDCLCKLYS